MTSTNTTGMCTYRLKGGCFKLKKGLYGNIQTSNINSLNSDGYELTLYTSCKVKLRMPLSPAWAW